MPRPNKEGLDYFPLDTNMEVDDKISLIEAKYGIEGFGVIIKLFKKIYATNGYYYEWNEQKQLLFSKQINVELNKVLDIVNDCLRWELFDNNLFKKYQILTSKRIQKTYLEATKRRKEIPMLQKYLLNGVNGYNNSINANIILINDYKSTQTETETETETESPKNKFSDDSNEIKLSQLLFEKIKERDEKCKEPDFQKWAIHIKKLIKLDNRNPEIIKQVIEWCQQDDFWQNNILSTEKLRKQFSQLLLKMNKKPEHKIIETSGVKYEHY